MLRQAHHERKYIIRSPRWNAIARVERSPFDLLGLHRPERGI